MKTLHLVIIIISCFCTIDLIFIQSNFFMQCGWQSWAQNSLDAVPCSGMVQNLQSIFGMIASAGIAAIIGITASFSPKKGAILIGVIASLYVSFILVKQILSFSFSVIPPGIMVPLTLTDRMLMTFVRSPLWFYIFAATIFGVIIWPLAVLRKKITGIFR
jgi:hypothetical protein